MYKLILTIRYLVKRRITHFAIAAVALCVFIVVVVMTVMAGLVGEFKQKNHDFVGDCIVGTDSLVGFPYYDEFLGILDQSGFVAGASPVVRNYALMTIINYGNRQFGVEILGIDPVLHSRTTSFARTLHFRADQPENAFSLSGDPNALGSVWGSDVVNLQDDWGRYKYGVQPPLLTIRLTCFPLNAKGAPAGAGSNPVTTQGFRCSDFSHSGIARVDGSLVYIPLKQAQMLCMNEAGKRVSAIYIRFRPEVGVSEGTRRVAELWNRFKQDRAGTLHSGLLDTVTVQDWKRYRRAFIAPMEKEQALLSLMFVLVGVTTVFIVFVVFYMIITNKKKDIGILKSVGASNASVLSLFCGFAFSVGLIGSSVGTLVGWLFLAEINRIEQWLYEHFGWQLWDRTIYAIGDIPSRIEPRIVAVIVASAIAACVVGALVPSYLAARLRPVETLHAQRT
ncbi:MAG: FtsX-like permease family protein [Phycisphaerae bacterium]|nr:FtsX-like permease family protein [Phycisphaerae bacterium]